MQKLNQIGFIGILLMFVTACGGGSKDSDVKSNEPINGKCGQAAQKFEFETTSYSGLAFCEAGNVYPNSPAFPEERQTVTWQCKGLYSGADTTCSASRKTQITTTPEQFTFDSENFIELGLVSNATVTITTIDEAHELFNTNTNEQGVYTIDTVELKQNILNILNEIPEFLLVSATGGIDTDPDDDGIIIEYEKVPLYGTVKSIVKAQKLLNEDNLSVNLISTAVANLIDISNVSDQKLTVLSKSLGMKDINNDGEIDNSDIVEYSMLNHESEAEELLRKNYLVTLHNNDLNASNEVLDNLKIEQFLIDVESEIIANTAYISLSTEHDDFTIYYGKNVQKDDVLSNEFSTPIPLVKNQYIAYKACNSSQTCGDIHVISFDGKKVELYISKEIESSMYDDTIYANSLRGEINSKYSNYLKVNQEIYIEELKTIELNNELEDIKEQIEVIEVTKML